MSSSLIVCWGGPMDGHMLRVRSVQDFDGIEFVGKDFPKRGARYRKDRAQRIKGRKMWRFVYQQAVTDGDDA